MFRYDLQMHDSSASDQISRKSIIIIIFTRIVSQVGVHIEINTNVLVNESSSDLGSCFATSTEPRNIIIRMPVSNIDVHEQLKHGGRIASRVRIDLKLAPCTSAEIVDDRQPKVKDDEDEVIIASIRNTELGDQHLLHEGVG